MLVRLWATGHIHKNVELATDGPYATVRHPLYLGNLVIFVGMALAANTVIATVMISVSVGLLYGLTIHYEERHLRRRFGGAYDQYTACVPVIIPRFHKGRLRLRKGSVPTQSSFLLSICGALLLVAIFELQEDLLEYLLGIEYNPVWGLDIPHIISHL